MKLLNVKKPGSAGLLLILAITAILYSRITDFSFIGYDDDVYIIENPDVRDFSFEGAKKILFNPEKPEELKPPITVLSLAFNYHFSGLDPSGYHLTNLILHLINIVLVFVVVKSASARSDFALFAAGVFALHPSFAEVVAWATARKDLLYGLFYLAALIFTFKYWKTGKIHFYLLIVLFFVLSYYSKYAAASFPVLYLALGILYYRRKNIIRTAAESIPFFIPPLYSFYLSVNPRTSSASALTENIQEQTERLPETAAKAAQAALEITVYDSFNLFQKIFLGGYSFIQYLIKFIFPVNQQLIYPYPPIDQNGNLPTEYYTLTALAVLIAGLVIFLCIKNKKLIHSRAGFGILFFGVTTALLLHVLPIGGRVVIADRYMYLPFIGLSVISFYLLRQVALKFNVPKLPKIAGIIFTVILAVILNNRISDFKSTETVFKDLINKEVRSAIPYNNLGKYYEERGRNSEALELLNKAIKIDPNYVEAVNNRGSVLINLNRHEEALNDLKRIIQANPGHSVALYNTGTAYEALKKYDSALYYYDLTIQADPEFYRALNNYGVILMDHKRQYTEAEKYFKKALQVKPDFARGYNNMGIIQRMEYEDIEAALDYFKKSVKVDPGFIDGHLNIARIYIDQGRLEEAEKKLKFILSRDREYVYAYFHLGITHLKQGNRELGCQNIITAHQKGFQPAAAYISRYCR